MMNRKGSYITVGIAVGMTAAFFFLVFRPQLRNLSDVHASIKDLDEQLDRRSASIAELSHVEANLKRADDLLADYRARIPTTGDVGDFVEDVSAVAERLGLRRQNIVPLPPEKLGSVTALPIRMSFETNFATVFNFLREIENLPRAARVTDLIVGQPERDEETGYAPEGELRTELTMQIFYEATQAGPHT